MGAGLATMKFMKPIVKVTKHGLRFISKNSNVILTIVGVTGVLATVGFAIKGTIKAVKLCEEKEVHGTQEIIKTVWKCYIPTIGMAILTTTAIIGNGRINAKKIAVLTSAYSGSVEALKKVEEKMSESIGPKKTEKAVSAAEAEMAQAQAPKSQNDIVATGKGKQLFFCASTGQWFYSDWNGIELAQAKLDKVFSDILRSWGSGEFVPVREAQEALGLPETDMSEYMGWDTDDFLDGDYVGKKNSPVQFVTSSEWMDLPWGREIVGIVRFTPWPINL